MLKPLYSYFVLQNQDADEFTRMPTEVQYSNAVVIAFGLFISTSFYINKIKSKWLPLETKKKHTQE